MSSGMNKELLFSYKLFNPLFWHVREAMRNPDIRYIWNRGGSSSGKSVSVVQAVLLGVFCGEGSALVLRKVGSSVKNTVYEEFKVQARRLHVYEFFKFIENNATCVNGMKIDFSGLDDPEKIKSITNYRWIIVEEATEFDYEDFTQLTFRLRGKKGLQIIAMFNPISEDSWIKTKILDTHKWTDLPADLEGKVKDSVTGKMLGKEYTKIKVKRTNQPKRIFNERTGEYETYMPDTVELVTTYQNNFWVVGSPDGLYGYYDRQTIANYQWYKENDYNFYRIYALGEWGSIKTGGEFLHAFDSNRHIRRVEVLPGLPVHVSIDNNVLPYISVSFFQIDGGTIRQFHEICAEDPMNTVTKAAEMTVSYLTSIGYRDVVYLYGDASTKSRNTIDDEKRSFLDKFVEGLERAYHVEERIPKGNPSVPMSGEFLNYILSGGGGMSFMVDDGCRKSIVDYNNAKKDVNGGILKARIKDKATGQSYEKYGHLTDCLRYIAVEAFNSAYVRFSLRRKRSTQREEDMAFYDVFRTAEGRHLTYVAPDLNGYFIVLRFNVHAFYDLESVTYNEGFERKGLRDCLDGQDGEIIFESERSFFREAKELREEGRDVRILTSKSSAARSVIEANMDVLRNGVRFRSDYDSLEEYASFVESMLDYRGEEEFQGLYAICSAVSYMRRKYPLGENNAHFGESEVIGV